MRSCHSGRGWSSVVVVCVLFLWSPAKVQAAEEEELVFNVGTDAEAEQSDEVGAHKTYAWGLARTTKQVVGGPAGHQKKGFGSWGGFGAQETGCWGLARHPKQAWL